MFQATEKCLIHSHYKSQKRSIYKEKHLYMSSAAMPLKCNTLIQYVHRTAHTVQWTVLWTNAYRFVPRCTTFLHKRS